MYNYIKVTIKHYSECHFENEKQLLVHTYEQKKDRYQKDRKNGRKR
jgi:hypothetical protein